MCQRRHSDHHRQCTPERALTDRLWPGARPCTNGGALCANRGGAVADGCGSIDRAGCTTDRKSVVWGKSVSVRVDLGGRCIIKKKTQHSKSKSDHNDSESK